ncbi:MAG: hypothetical protein SNJ55_02730 [Chloroherpetonaceae bacterium]
MSEARAPFSDIQNVPKQRIIKRATVAQFSVFVPTLADFFSVKFYAGDFNKCAEKRTVRRIFAPSKSFECTRRTPFQRPF